MGKFRIKVNVELVECDDPLNQEPNRVDEKIGRFTFTAHSVFQGGQTTYNTARDLFVCLQGVEFYKTIDFKDIAMIYGDT